MTDGLMGPPGGDSPPIDDTPSGAGGTYTNWQPVGGGYASGIDTKQRELVFPAANGPWALVYGNFKIAPSLTLCHSPAPQYDYFVCHWAIGEIASIDSIDFSSNANINQYGVAYDEPSVLLSYTGTLTQTANASLAALGSLSEGWPFRLLGRAYSVLRAAPDQDPSLITSVTATGTGLKIYDPRTSASYAVTDRIYSRNPIWLATTVIADWWGMNVGYANVDWTRCEDAADYADVLVDGDPRFALDVWLRQGMSARTLLNTIALHCRGYWGRDSGTGKWFFDINRPRSSTFIFSDDQSKPNIAPETVKVWGRQRLKEPSWIEVDFTDPDSFEYGTPVTVVNPRTTSGARPSKIQLPWCQGRSQARRIGVWEFYKRLRNPRKVVFRTGDDAQAVQQGDIVTFTGGNVLDGQLLEIDQIEKHDGDFSVIAHEYDSAHFSDEIEDQDTPASWTEPGSTPTDPDAPTAAEQIFIEAGNWDIVNGLSHADDLTASQGWTIDAGFSASYASNETTFTKQASGDALAYQATGLRGLHLITFLMKTSASDDEAGFAIMDSALSVSSWATSIPGDGLYHRRTIIVDLDGTENFVFNLVAGDTGETLTVKRMRVISWESYDTTLALIERWEWTEHASAPASVLRYEMVSASDPSIIRAQVSEGTAALEHTIIRVGDGGPTERWTDGKSASVSMRVVGTNYSTADFPTPTQSTESRINVITIDPSAFSGSLGSSDNSLDLALSVLDAGAIPVVRSVKSKTLTSGSAVELLRLFCASDRTNGATLWYHIEVTDGSANTDSETGFVSMNVERPAGTVTVATPVKGVTNPGSGAMSVVFATGTGGADHGRLNVNATTGISSPTLTIWMTLIGGSDQDVTWS